MTTKYYDTVTKTQVVDGVHDIGGPNVVALDESNPFFSPLPAGQQLTYDGGVPDGLEAIPPFVPTTAQQAVIDLRAAGVNSRTVEAAMYLDHRGNAAPLAAIDASIDAVVVSSSLSLDVVSGLVV